jgi:hypothetical protein
VEDGFIDAFLQPALHKVFFWALPLSLPCALDFPAGASGELSDLEVEFTVAALHGIIFLKL